MNEKPENFEYLEKCPVCSDSDFMLFRKGTFDFFHLNKEQIKITDSHYGNVWDLSRCQKCHHIFANPCPSPEFITSLYSQIVDPLYEEEAEGRSKNFLRILSRLEKIHPAKGALFDVGAATGILLNLARQRGWEPAGIEASSWAVEKAKEKYHVQLVEDSFEKAALRQNFYSAVTMIDFIEHTPRPLDSLAKAHKILIPGGVLSLVTPDIHSFASKISGKKWWHLRPAHLSYFSSKSLLLLLHETGFKPLKKKKYSWTFSAYYLILQQGLFKSLDKNPSLASFLKKIPIKLALSDSFEIYAIKEKRD